MPRPPNAERVRSGRRGLPTGLRFVFTATLAWACEASPPRPSGRDAHVDAPPPADASGETNAPDAPGEDAVPDDGTVPLEGCPVVVTYRATSSVARVFVAGEWNGFEPGPDELTDDGSGLYTVELRLRPGLYAYKLYVRGDGLEPWRLDPHNPYRVWHEGVENSGLRVDDCSRPRLRVHAHRIDAARGRFEAELVYEARFGGSLDRCEGTLRTGLARRPLTPAELQPASAGCSLRLEALPRGKHRVDITAISTRGARSPSLLLPFWIEPEPFDWRDALVYMVVVDRFRNGDPSNDAPVGDASPGADWYGGDLEGLRAAVRDGWFDALGVRAIWLTPVQRAAAGSEPADDGVHRVSGYHGYWPVHATEVEDRLGGAEALEALVAEAHARGIRVLGDLVVNHVHQAHPYVREHPEWFRSGCVCGTAGCDWTERRLDCVFRPYMPDVDWTVREAQERMLEDATAFVERFDLDGLRIDAVKHVPDSAIVNLALRMRERFETVGTRFYLVGETAMGWDPSAGPDEGANRDHYGTIARYLAPGGPGLDGQLDFVLHHAVLEGLLRDRPGRGMVHVDYWTRASLERFGPHAVMMPFVGSHDAPRFVSLVSDPVRASHRWSDLPEPPTSDEPYDRLYVALAWLFALPGAPLLYYGDEIGMPGGSDPDNRRPMRFEGSLSAREGALLERVRRLGRARARLPGLRRGGYRTVAVTEDSLAFARGRDADLVLVVVHRGSHPLDWTLPIPRELLPEDSRLVDELGEAGEIVVRRAAIRVRLGPRRAAYLRRR
ncbi:MAG: alpha-amylase family glycosyl hydrolase [Myxococcota bacterium]|nr:alpha-amylase family glycosyl hydrolase [Myxococcota bacterium]MDW8363144.1 alpha-amylase family glycosyl hydrolase [Myxococcales bacterium]